MQYMSTALFTKTQVSSPKLNHFRHRRAFPKCPHRNSCSLSTPASLIEPDGGTLVDLVAPARPARDSRRREAAGPLPRVGLSQIDLEWVHVLSEGWASPFGGFMIESEFLQTLHFNLIRYGNGSVVNMSVTIVLAKKRGIGDRRKVVLVDDSDKPIAILNRDVFESPCHITNNGPQSSKSIASYSPDWWLKILWGKHSWWLPMTRPSGKLTFSEPSRPQDFLFISGTKMRTLAKNKENPPDGFMCPGGWNVLIEYYDSVAASEGSKNVRQPVAA